MKETEGRRRLPRLRREGCCLVSQGTMASLYVSGEKLKRSRMEASLEVLMARVER